MSKRGTIVNSAPMPPTPITQVLNYCVNALKGTYDRSIIPFHTVYIRTVRSKCLLSALLKWFVQAIWAEQHRTLLLRPDQPGKESNVPNLKKAKVLQVILYEIDCVIFYSNLHELSCQFISWRNWVNFGKFIDNCWISSQVMTDSENFYNDLIIISLYCPNI